MKSEQTASLELIGKCPLSGINGYPGARIHSDHGIIKNNDLELFMWGCKLVICFS